MDEAEVLCDRLVIIDAGRIVAEGTPDSIRGEHRTLEAAYLELTEPSLLKENRMKSLATLTRVEAALLAREPAAVAFTLLLPLILLVLNGSGGNQPNPTFGGAGTVDVLMSGYLVYVMATSAIMQMPETLADYRDRGILRRMRITPLKPWQILGSHALTHAAMIAAGAALLITVGVVAYNLNPPASITATLLALVVSSAAMLGIGFLLGALLPSVRTTQAVAAAIYFPAIFVSGALFPTRGTAELRATARRRAADDLRCPHHPGGVDRGHHRLGRAGRAGRHRRRRDRRGRQAVPLGSPLTHERSRRAGPPGGRLGPAQRAVARAVHRHGGHPDPDLLHRPDPVHRRADWSSSERPGSSSPRIGSYWPGTRNGGSAGSVC